MPTRLSRRAVPSRLFTSSSSRSRPMNDVAWCGRLFGISLTGSHQSPVQTTRCAFSASAGGANCASSAPISNSSIGSATPLTRQYPCETTLCAHVPSASRAAAESSVWPPRAKAITLAAIGLARPSTSSGFAPRAMSSAAFSRRITGPTCKPTRAESDVGSVASARWYSIA